MGSAERMRAYRRRLRYMEQQSERRKELQEFREWLTFRRYAERSVVSYLKNVRLIAGKLGGFAKLDTATTADLNAVFLNGWSASHHNQVRQALLLYYRFLGVTDNPAVTVPGLKRGQHLPRPYSAEETVRYLKSAVTLGPKYAAFAFLGVYAGLRIHEVAKLAWDDVTARYIVVKGKGGKERNVPMHPALRKVLDAWRVECSGAWLFPSRLRDGSPVRPNAVYEWHREVVDAAGFHSGVRGRDGFHRTRHTSATALLRVTKDLRKVQQFLGHSSPATTAVYTLVDDEDLYQDVSKVTWGG